MILEPIFNPVWVAIGFGETPGAWAVARGVVVIPPKLSVSDYIGIIKGRTAIRVLNKFGKLKKKPYWGIHFMARGYCLDTVGLDADKICRYVKYQEAKERQSENRQQRLFLIKPGTTPRPLWGKNHFYPFLEVNSRPIMGVLTSLILLL